MGKNSRFAVGAIIAAGVGYIAGILTAPKSGKETRHDIHDKAVQTKEEVLAKLEQVSAELGSTINSGKTRIKSLESSAREEVEKAVNTAVVAKDKARDVIAAIKTGEAEDKDLKNAVKDVNKAIDNLKKYLDKHA